MAVVKYYFDANFCPHCGKPLTGQHLPLLVENDGRRSVGRNNVLYVPAEVENPRVSCFHCSQGLNHYLRRDYTE